MSLFDPLFEWWVGGRTQAEIDVTTANQRAITDRQWYEGKLTPQQYQWYQEQYKILDNTLNAEKAAASQGFLDSLSVDINNYERWMIAGFIALLAWQLVTRKY